MFFASRQLLLSLPEIISTLAFSESSASFLSLPHLSLCGHSPGNKEGKVDRGPQGPLHFGGSRKGPPRPGSAVALVRPGF